MKGAARFLNNIYGNLVGTINGFTVEKSVPSNAEFTDTKYTPATAAPGKVASSSSTGTSTNYARQDHTHGIDLATGDNNGQVKIAGTNISVKGLGAAAYMGTGTTSSTVALGNHTHNYAGSSSAGGSANSAVKLDSASVGSTSCPVYFTSAGKPEAVTTTAAAASGGTALTVVTTGEKYTWNSKANGSHTHNYAGSSSAGGVANSAAKLTTNNSDTEVGKQLQPVYFNAGVPVASTGNTIPYIVGTGSTAGTWLGELTGLTEYTDGLLILYKPSVKGASTTTLNLNNLGAKTCYINGGTKLTTHFAASQPILLVYSASQNSGCWMALDNYWTDSNTVPSAHCTTADSTAAKAASCTYWTATSNSYIHVLFRYENTVTGAITLNINSTGAKPIYINGTASSATNHTLPAGSYIAFYNGTNYYFRTDGKLPADISGNAATATVADKLQSTSVGSSTNPVYFTSQGKPQAITCTIQTSVPANAVFTDTHHQAKLVTCNSSTGTSQTSSILSNGNVYLNLVENNTKRSSHKISGSGSAEVTTDASGNIVVTATDTKPASGTGINVSTSGATATITNTGVRSITTGSSNGTISVNTNGTSANVSVYGLNNAAYKDVDSKPTNLSTNLIESGGVHNRIAFVTIGISSSNWEGPYDDNTFNASGIYRQAIPFADFTSSTQIVSVQLHGYYSGGTKDNAYYDQQFALISEVETGQSYIEFRATGVPTIGLNVIIGYVKESLSSASGTMALPTNDRYTEEPMLSGD